MKHFVSSLASQNRDFWLQMAITQRRIIKDVQILAYTKKIKAQCYPQVQEFGSNQFLGWGKNMSAISRKFTFSVGNLENFEKL